MKNTIFTMCMVALSTTGFGQIVFNQNYVMGVKVGDIEYTITDTLIQVEVKDPKSIKQYDKTGIPTIWSYKVKLVNRREAGNQVYYIYNGSYTDDLGFEVRCSITIISNFDNKGNYMTNTKTFNTFNNSSQETSTYYSKI